MKKFLFAVVSGALFFQSCKSDKPGAGSGNPPGDLTKKVWVINEGGFQAGNASLGIYDPKDSVYSGAVFQTVNSRPLGDIFQSVQIIDGEAFLVINNSQKIEIIRTDDYTSTGTITGLTSPRHILPIAGTKAYISEYYTNSLAILNPQTREITGHLPCNGWSDRMYQAQNKAFVTRPLRDYLYVFNTLTNALIDSIKVDYGANSLAEDENGMLWILCSGESWNNHPAGIHKIDPATLEVVLNLELEAAKAPSGLQISPDRKSLYFLYDGVMNLSVSSTSLPASPVINTSDKDYAYSLGVDPENGDIYLSDARDFAQKGTIYRYNNKHQLLDTFEAGVIPGGFYFE